MNAFVSELVHQQHIDIDRAPGRPRFAAECVRFSECFSLPVPGPVQYRVFAQIPGDYGQHTVTWFASSTEAMRALNSALWCGSSYATIDYQVGTTWTQEVWCSREGGL